MKIDAVFIVLSLLSLPFITTGAKMDGFQGGDMDVIIDLTDSSHSAVVNLILPAQCYALGATMKVTGGPVDGSYPVDPEVALDDAKIWAFYGTGYGSFGNQTMFSSGNTQLKTQFGASGGTEGTAIRLPRDAIVQNATLEVNASVPIPEWSVMTKFASVTGDGIGQSVSSAGDVNNDGYDDVIVGALFNNASGAQAGGAYIHFGGPVMDSTPDALLIGTSPGEQAGCSVSSAGDVNNDGYDDVIMGAYGNDAGGFNAGRAYIYFGGQEMDNGSFVMITGNASYEYLGFSVSNAGDVNNDGYGDVIIGTDWYGSAYIYFGGPAMDVVPDVTFTGPVSGDIFGSSVSTAGDVNNDGFDDVIVGAYGAVNNTGLACIYFGGSSMDNVSDVTLRGVARYDRFGFCVSNAGDLNNDDHDDVIVGACDASGGAGRAYVFFGGPAMDNSSDVTLAGSAWGDRFGYSVSNVGDANRDGYDDLIVGAVYNNSNSPDAGSAYIYFGGLAMDNMSDATFSGAAEGDHFRFSVSDAGDVDKDGYIEAMIGAEHAQESGFAEGTAYLFSSLYGILNSNMTLGSNSIWNKEGYFNGIAKTGDFSNAVNEYLGSGHSVKIDNFGNSYLDVPIKITTDSVGNITLFGLQIIYQYTTIVPDFSVPLNNYISKHQDTQDANGDISVPLILSSRTAGELELFGLDINYDGAPMLVEPIPQMAIDEDTINSTLMDPLEYFHDEYDPDSGLEFSIENATNSSKVNVRILGDHFLCADTATGTANDNWTGIVSLRIRCMDSRGFSTVSNVFDLVIRNVNDPPIITSIPPLLATVGDGYVYPLMAVDGDNDALAFSLAQRPDNMEVTADGEILWIPSRTGEYNVSVAVGDGQITAYQNFKINVLPNGNMTENRLPRITSMPVTNAMVGVQYLYEIHAIDDDNDTLNFSLVNRSEGMDIDPNTGRISWTPMASQVGDNPISVKVTDGRGGAAGQTFIINVKSAPRLECSITVPVNGTKVRGMVLLNGTTTKGDRNIFNVRVRIDEGAWLKVNGTDNWTYKIDTNGLENGWHVFEARAFDGMNYSDTALVTLMVDNPKPHVSNGNGLWGVLLAAVLVTVAAVGVLIWKMWRRKGSKQ